MDFQCKDQVRKHEPLVIIINRCTTFMFGLLPQFRERGRENSKERETKHLVN